MNFNGYECKTTFWDDFSIAERFGISAIKDTFKRAFQGWKDDVEYVTELVMVLNWKCWYFYQKKMTELSKLYEELYYKADEWCCENLKGDDLSYYYKTTD